MVDEHEYEIEISLKSTTTWIDLVINSYRIVCIRNNTFLSNVKEIENMFSHVAATMQIAPDGMSVFRRNNTSNFIIAKKMTFILFLCFLLQHFCGNIYKTVIASSYV